MTITPRQENVGRSSPKRNIVFILVGAVRTLNVTQESLLTNLIGPLCPRADCIAHVVTHFSYSDNRPGGDDPMGSAIPAASMGDGTTTRWPKFEWATSDGYRRHYEVVPAYNIASPEEQEAMETMEQEYYYDASSAINKTHVAKRLHLLRKGDPRRYSMWFARAWAWRFTKQILPKQHPELQFVDSFFFQRPDMLWFLPGPTYDYLEKYKKKGDPAREAWFHDSYYSAVPDTFAYLPNHDVADAYFSLEPLVEPGVACLGGPSFNQTKVRIRLQEQGLSVPSDFWCKGEGNGWSEGILQEKLRKAEVERRWFPAGSTILRPPKQLLCEPLTLLHGWVEYSPTHVTTFSCLMIEHYGADTWKVDDAEKTHPFRWRSLKNSTLYLSRHPEGGSAGSLLIPQPCVEHPMVPPEQMFAGTNDEVSGFSSAPPVGLVTNVTVPSAAVLLEGSWMKEPIQLYTENTFLPNKASVA